jgi:DNA mismatch repair protein MutS
MDRLTAAQYYRQIKALYPKHIVLIRLGDFYETFDGDADILSEVCGCIKVRLGGKGGAWMAGFPRHAIEDYIKKLLTANHYVALIDPN